MNAIQLNEAHNRLSNACLLLMMAEKTKIENKSIEMVAYRKQLKASEPKLFVAYMKRVSTGTFLNITE